MSASATRYDVFLSHNSADKLAVQTLADRLRAAGLAPFLDIWHLIPGTPWQEGIEDALTASATVAVFVGPSGISPWHNEEMRDALDRAVRGRNDYRVIPVLLPGADEGSVSRFLARRVWVDFRSGLDDEAALQRLVAGVKGEAIEVGSYQLLDEPAPYRGLLPFEAEHARFFFGRDDDVRRLAEKLGQQRFVAVVGASGSGKSSLVKAGLLPKLKANALPDSRHWHILTMTPGSQPIRSLASQLSSFVPPPDRPDAADKLTSRLAERTDGLRTALNAFLADRPLPVLLFIDQFEELFTLCADGPERCRMTTEQFIANLADAVERGDGRIRIILTLRADFLDRCLAFPVLRKLLEDCQLLLGPLDAAGLREAIVRPASAVGALLEKGLVEIVLRDIRSEPGMLPLLQQALYELWLRRRGPWLTLDAYEASGGVLGALQKSADNTYQTLTQPQQKVASRIFLRLIQFGEGRGNTRRQQLVEELQASGDDPVLFDQTLARLTESRLLTTSGDVDGGARRVDIAHEALIAGWPRLQGWLHDRKEAEQARRRLEDKAREWVRLGRGQGGLLDKEELVEASAWLDSSGTAELGMSSDLLAFVAASRKALNPGWHRWGTLVTVIGAISLTALVAWVFITIETSGLRGIGRATIVLFLLGLSVFLALAVWQIVRSGPFLMQRLSQLVAAQRSLQATIGMVAVIAVFLWVGFGVRAMRLTTDCAELGYTWTSASTGIAVIADGTDPKETAFFRLALKNAVDDPEKTEVVIPRDSSDAETCRALFSYRITLSSRRGTAGQEGVYEVSITPAPRNGSTLSSVGAGCGQIFVLAHRTAIALGLSTGIVPNCMISDPVSCEPWDLNELAYALHREERYDEAVAAFERIIERYPDFAWAHHNLGQARLFGCGDLGQAARDLQTAVALSNGTCGWFLYDSAVACLRTQDYTCALDAAQRAIQVDPSFLDAYSVLVVTLRELGQLDQAEIRLDQYAQQLERYDPGGLERRIALEKNRGILAFEQREFDAAWQHLRRAERNLTLGNLFRSVARDQPLPAYEEEIVFYLARILEEQGKAAKACDFWRRYSGLPQGCLFGEVERRAYVASRLTMAMCASQ